MAAQAEMTAQIIKTLLDQQKRENSKLTLIPEEIQKEIRDTVYATITSEPTTHNFYKLMTDLKTTFSNYNGYSYNSYSIYTVVINILVELITNLKKNNKSVFNNKYVVELGMRCISDFCRENHIYIDDVVTITCILTGHGDNKTCSVANMSKKKVTQPPSIIHAVAPGHKALFTMVPHISDVMHINPQTGTPYIETLRDVRRQVNTHYGRSVAFYEEQLEYIEEVLTKIYIIKNIKDNRDFLTDIIDYTNSVITKKDKLSTNITVEQLESYMNAFKEHTQTELQYYKDMIESMKTQASSVFGTYSSSNPNELPLKILHGTECSNINKPTFIVLFESQFDIVKSVFFLFMNFGNATSSYSMSNDYEGCIETFKTALRNNGLNNPTNYFNNFDITSSDAISRYGLQGLLYYMYPSLNLKIDNILPAISDSGDRDVQMDPSGIVSYFFHIIRTIYMTCCRVGEIPDQRLTRKNSGTNLDKLKGGRRYKKSKCPYCGNCKNSIMYFDFTNLRNSTNNQKIVPKMISWDKLFNGTSVQKYKKNNN